MERAVRAEHELVDHAGGIGGHAPEAALALAQGGLHPEALGGFLLVAHRGEAQLEDFHDGGGQIGEGGAVILPEFARLGVDQAKRADGQAGGGTQGRTGVEADPQRAGDQRIVGETGVLRGVGHDEDARFRRQEDGVGAERHVARGFANVDAVVGFEPLPFPAHEADQHDRDVEKAGGEARDAVKRGFRPRVEDLVLREGFQAGFLVGWQRGGHGSSHPVRAVLGPKHARFRNAILSADR